MGEVISLEEVRNQRKLSEYLKWITDQDSLIDYGLLIPKTRKESILYSID